MFLSKKLSHSCLREGFRLLTLTPHSRRCLWIGFLWTDNSRFFFRLTKLSRKKRKGSFFSHPLSGVGAALWLFVVPFLPVILYLNLIFNYNERNFFYSLRFETTVVQEGFSLACILWLWRGDQKEFFFHLPVSRIFKSCYIFPLWNFMFLKWFLIVCFFAIVWIFGLSAAILTGRIHVVAN